MVRCLGHVIALVLGPGRGDPQHIVTTLLARYLDPLITCQNLPVEVPSDLWPWLADYRAFEHRLFVFGCQQVGEQLDEFWRASACFCAFRCKRSSCIEEFIR